MDQKIKVPLKLEVGDVQSDGLRYSLLKCETAPDYHGSLNFHVRDHAFAVSNVVEDVRAGLRRSELSVSKCVKIHVYFDGNLRLPDSVLVSVLSGDVILFTQWVSVVTKMQSPTKNPSLTSLYCHRKVVKPIWA